MKEIGTAISMHNLNSFETVLLLVLGIEFIIGFFLVMMYKDVRLFLVFLASAVLLASYVMRFYIITKVVVFDQSKSVTEIFSEYDVIQVKYPYYYISDE